MEDRHDLAGGGQQRFSNGSVPTGQLQQAGMHAGLLIGTVCACQQLLNVLQGPAGLAVSLTCCLPQTGISPESDDLTEMTPDPAAGLRLACRLDTAAS